MLVTIFYQTHEFCKFLEKETELHLIGERKNVGRKSQLEISQIMTIIIMFHYSGYQCFKWYYINHVLKYQRADFPNLVGYTRFVELQQYALLPMMLFFKMTMAGECTGISVIDSMPLRVCHIKREYSHKTFKGVAKKGKTSTGWFFGVIHR